VASAGANADGRSGSPKSFGGVGASASEYETQAIKVINLLLQENYLMHLFF